MPIKLEIRKKSGNVWEYVRLDQDDIVGSSKQHLTTIDENSEKSVIFTQPYGNNFAEYKLEEVAVYDDSTGLSMEVFTDLPEFQNRLKVLGNPSFSSGADLVIADLISSDASNAIILGADGKLYASSSGGGGGSVLSVFGRQGTVVAQSGDYSMSQITDGIPSGGLENEILKKSSDSDYDYEWGANVPNISTDADNIAVIGADGGLFVPAGIPDSGSANLRYIFASPTNPQEPTANTLQINNADLSLATEIYFSTTAYPNRSVNNILELLKQGDALYLQQSSDDDFFINANIIGQAVDNGSFFTVPIEIVTSGQPFQPNSFTDLIVYHSGGGNGNEPTQDGDLIYKGDWNPITNIPTLSNDDIGKKGFTYRVSETGEIDLGFILGSDIFNTGFISNVADTTANFINGGLSASSNGNGSELRPRVRWDNLTLGGTYQLDITDIQVISGSNPDYSFNNGNGYIDFVVPITEKTIVFTYDNNSPFISIDGTDVFDVNISVTLKEVTSDPKTYNKGDIISNDGDIYYKFSDNNQNNLPKLVENLNVSGTYDIDYSFDTWNLVVTGATSFTESNLPLSETNTKVITLYVQGEFPLTFPAGWSTNIIGEYDGAVRNQIVVEFIKTGDYAVDINQPD